MLFPDFFKQARSDARDPYHYQKRLACGEPPKGPSEDEWLRSPGPCESRLISIPTGLGKTAAVVLAWLWNRVHHRSDQWPRRLVYCLPMRTLVEQTAGEAQNWLDQLHEKNLIRGRKPRVIILMGGENLEGDAKDWDLYPEEDAILIGTQDMLLSRALNRGYGMSRYRWPMHFGLLNNDCLWVLDETQLMGPGLSTACQLEAFRSLAPQGFDSYGSKASVTWYMSATTNLNHLQTREWRGVARPREFEFGLTPEEKNAKTGAIHQRRSADKVLELQRQKTFADSASAKTLVSDILNRHAEMLQAITGNTTLPARTLVICNTVDRAKEVHAQLTAEKPDGCDMLLLHSRFRPIERRTQMERLKKLDRGNFPKGQIVIATQVIEAGVDVSSGILWSEVAPLASLVQRLGRINRAGEFNQSQWKPLAFIIGVGEQAETGNAEAKKEIRKKNAERCLPYELANCGENAVWKPLEKLKRDASPASLEAIQSEIADSIPRCPYSLQRHELLDFFDTDSNLSLGFTDVSPFVRGLDEDTDIQVCWRESWPQEDGSEGTDRPDFTPDFQRDELCSVPIGKALKARDILNHGWIWRGKGNGKQSGWISVRDSGITPGMTILLSLSAGGYDKHAGWTGNKDDNKHSSSYEPREELTDDEHLSYLNNGWRNIADHTKEVGDELTEVLRHLMLENEPERTALATSVPWHDIGKNLPDWQTAVDDALEKAGITGKDEHKPFAKFSLSESPSLRDLTGRELQKEIARLKRMFRPGVAHEVAAALAFRQAEQTRLGSGRDADLASLLAEYLIMSHHGHVRKVLRDEIPRFPESRDDTETVRGIVHGGPLPAVTINGQSLGCDALSTDCRKMGRSATDGHESYTRGVLRLLEHYGPFRLAYLEAIFRASDVRASIKASENGNA